MESQSHHIAIAKDNARLTGLVEQVKTRSVGPLVRPPVNPLSVTADSRWMKSKP
jgi:hypothetical protein